MGFYLIICAITRDLSVFTASIISISYANNIVRQENELLLDIFEAVVFDAVLY